MNVTLKDGVLTLGTKDQTLLTHSAASPMLYLGQGEETVDMYRGNFQIRDYLVERRPLRAMEIREAGGAVSVNFEGVLEMEISTEEDRATLRFTCLEKNVNRFFLRLPAEKDEAVYGCGEQMSYFNLRGRRFPLWTSEPGVGRDKTTYVTWRSDVENKAGGDYYNTNFPAPLYLSSRRYSLTCDSTAYAEFDFTHEGFHELQFWNVPGEIVLETAQSMLSLLKKLTARLGRQKALPEWVYEGAVLGLQGGTERVEKLLRFSKERGVEVSGLWLQDWEGKRVTSFGKRLQWDWRWNSEMYPGLPEKREEWEKEGIRLLGYINPYLVNDGLLYKEGAEKGYYTRAKDGGEYLVDFGEFDCGVVDLTNPEAYEWFKGIIKKNLIGFGLSGWMADFGEYLPTDTVLHSGEDAMILHNAWPALWARCNYEALEETGMLGEALVFMRAGGMGTQRYCPLLWAGDQSVDFTIHDGLASVIVGALSAAMSGCGLHHSDIGGYTSLFGNCRTREVFLRWAEMAAFTPVMRTHEGNRPDENFQYYDDEDATVRFGRLTKIYRRLKPYLMAAAEENEREGVPVQRPLLLHYESDPNTRSLQTEYLLGRDVLVAPVYLGGKTDWEAYLPEDQWIHLWSGKEYGGGSVTVPAPLGYPPVFYRKDSPYRDLFAGIGKDFA